MCLAASVSKEGEAVGKSMEAAASVFYHQASDGGPEAPGHCWEEELGVEQRKARTNWNILGTSASICHHIWP